MKYFISDLHLGHDRDFIYKIRGFNSIEEHDKAIINNWNEIVNDEDEVYILGDLIVGDDKKGISCLLALKGKKYFIKGNHDSSKRVKLYEKYGLEYLGESKTLNKKDMNGYTIYLSHYPTLVDNYDVGKPLKRRVINIHGHRHDAKKFIFPDYPTVYNVNVDVQDMRPISFDQIIKEIKDEMENEA